MESSTAEVASTSDRLSVAVACITVESSLRPRLRLKQNSHSFAPMETSSTPTVTQLRAASSGCNIFWMELCISSTPKSRIRNATIMEAMYSMRAWPKGCLRSAGLFAILKLTNEITEDPASDRLLTASATLDTLPVREPTANLPAKSRAFRQMPTAPATLPQRSRTNVPCGSSPG